MGKWNNGSSIPVLKLEDSELKEAIKEWSEGNRHLERFLWNCHNVGVITNGCDAGDHHFPYVGFALEESSIENLKRILVTTQKMGKNEIFIMFCGNPYSGPNWYKPTLTILPINPKDANLIFDELSNVLENKENIQTDEGFVNILKFYELLKDKESGFDISMTITSNAEYIFSINCFCNERNWQYFTDLLCEAGLKKVVPKEKSAPVMKWMFKTEEESEFNLCVKRTLEVLTTKWCLEVPKKITKDMDFNSKALLVRRKLKAIPYGLKLFDMWLKVRRLF